MSRRGRVNIVFLDVELCEYHRVFCHEIVCDTRNLFEKRLTCCFVVCFYLVDDKPIQVALDVADTE